jgi:translocation and assembly module TamB
LRRWLRRIAVALAALATVFALALGIVDTDIGHRWVVERIGAVRTNKGLRFTVGRIDGSLYGAAQLKDVRVYDLDGLLVQAPAVTLDWRPWEWWRNRLVIERLAIGEATLFHAPRTRKSAKPGPILPEFDIRIGALLIDRLVLARPVLGSERVGRVAGRADIRHGRAFVRLDALVAGSDRLAVRIDAEPASGRFDVDVRAAGAAGGVLARGLGLKRAVTLEVDGEGGWSRWQGRAIGRAGGERVIDLALGAAAGRYTLSGQLVPGRLIGGLAQRLASPRVLVNGTATFVARRLDGAIDLRSPAAAPTASILVPMRSATCGSGRGCCAPPR